MELCHLVSILVRYASRLGTAVRPQRAMPDCAISPSPFIPRLESVLSPNESAATGLEILCKEELDRVRRNREKKQNNYF